MFWWAQAWVRLGWTLVAVNKSMNVKWWVVMGCERLSQAWKSDAPHTLLPPWPSCSYFPPCYTKSTLLPVFNSTLALAVTGAWNRVNVIPEDIGLNCSIFPQLWLVASDFSYSTTYSICHCKKSEKCMFTWKNTTFSLFCAIYPISVLL